MEPMRAAADRIRLHLDRLGLAISGLCLLHCVATVALVAGLGLGGGLLLNPDIHRIGLVLACVVAAVAIGWGALRHRRRTPFVVAMTGLSFMGGALAVPHGLHEALFTLIGVSLVGAGHLLNLRKAASSHS